MYVWIVKYVTKTMRFLLSQETTIPPCFPSSRDTLVDVGDVHGAYINHIQWDIGETKTVITITLDAV